MKVFNTVQDTFIQRDAKEVWSVSISGVRILGIDDVRRSDNRWNRELDILGLRIGFGSTFELPETRLSPGATEGAALPPRMQAGHGLERSA